jgi:hypothetical protein
LKGEPWSVCMAFCLTLLKPLSMYLTELSTWLSQSF